MELVIALKSGGADISLDAALEHVYGYNGGAKYDMVAGKQLIDPIQSVVSPNLFFTSTRGIVYSTAAVGVWAQDNICHLSTCACATATAVLPSAVDTSTEMSDADPDAEVDGMAAKLAGWEKRKLKYEKYAEKGKPEKLEKAMEKQRAKLQKATDKGKPQEYLMYKAEKIEFTQKMWTLAHLVANMKRAGFLPQC